MMWNEFLEKSELGGGLIGVMILENNSIVDKILSLRFNRLVLVTNAEQLT